MYFNRRLIVMKCEFWLIKLVLRHSVVEYFDFDYLL
jgi:hypothetical protein